LQEDVLSVTGATTPCGILFIYVPSEWIGPRTLEACVAVTSFRIETDDLPFSFKFPKTRAALQTW